MTPNETPNEQTDAMIERDLCRKITDDIIAAFDRVGSLVGPERRQRIFLAGARAAVIKMTGSQCAASGWTLEATLRNLDLGAVFTGLIIAHSIADGIADGIAADPLADRAMRDTALLMEHGAIRADDGFLRAARVVRAQRRAAPA